ncbi:unnamed protein product, partial [Laminaria digitata]
MGRCQYKLCKVTAHYNDEGRKLPAYCKKHAEDGMVNVGSRRCSHDTCMKHPSFNVA